MVSVHDGCQCYVRYLEPETKFVVRRGAHNPNCPAFRLSGDLEDQSADSSFRKLVEIPTDWARGN
jgi:hypothetical protein